MESEIHIPKEFLRTIALRLRKLGVPTETIIEGLGIPKWTLAGWLAHETRKQRKSATPAPAKERNRLRQSLERALPNAKPEDISSICEVLQSMGRHNRTSSTAGSTSSVGD